MRREMRLGLVLVLLVGFGAPLWAADRDGDGIADEIELALGADPGRADKLQLICDDKALGAGDQTANARRKLAPDLTQVWFGNLAGDRYVWRLDFAEDFVSAGTVLILYLDADNDPKTGRQDGDWVRGCDVMLTCVSGGFSPSVRNATVCSADQNLRGVVDGKSVYFSMDLKLKQNADGRSEYRGYVLCHRSDLPADSDSSAWFTVQGPGASALPKPRVGGISEARSQGMVFATPWLGWRDDLLAARAIPLDAKEATVEGMRHFDRALVPEANNSTASFRLPVSGSYHVGVVVQDSAVGEEVLHLRVGDQEVGRLNCLQNDGVFHLFTTAEPVKLSGTLTLVADAPAQDFQISEVLLLPKVVAPRPLEVSHLETFCPPQPTGPTVGMEVCFLTNAPCLGAVKWGEGTALDQTTAEAGAATYNHRVMLTGLKRGATYRVQAVAGPSAEPATCPAVSFVAAEKRLAAGRVRLERLTLRLLHGQAAPPGLWPVCGGVPFPQGLVGERTGFRLLDAAGQPVTADFGPLAYWPDGSVKWLKVSAVVRSDGQYVLEYGERVRTSAPPAARAVSVKPTAEGLEVTNGVLRVALAKARFTPPGTVWKVGESEPLLRSERGLVLTDAAGQVYTSAGAAADRLEVEEAGPAHTVVLAEGPLTGPAGKLMRYRCRLHFYAGFPGVPLVVTLVNDHGDQVVPPTLTEITSLTLPLTVPGAEVAPERRLQAYDTRFLVEHGGQRTEQTGHDTGTATLGPVSVTVKDYWQLFPKAFSVSGDQLTAELFPALPADEYAAHTDPKLLTQNYFWANKGKYRLPCGSCPSYDLLVYFGADDVKAGQAFQSPALLAATPERYCSTNVFGDLAPAKPGVLDAYNRFMDAGLVALEDRRQRGHEYSWINYGDWYGERSVNWGNLEYDLPWGLLLGFARTGDYRYFDRAEQAARHVAGIDTVTVSPNPDQLGLFHLHCVGHTGGFDTPRVPDAEYWFVSGGNDIGHTYDQGNFAASLVTGDPRYGESAHLVADWIAGHFGASLSYYVHRNFGWAIITMMGAYHSTSDPYYLNAARLFADYVVAKQDPGTGVWAHPIGECEHKPQHMGGKVFMSGVVMTGLKLLDQVEPDRALRRALLRNCDWMYNRMWHEDVGGFEYAQCPQFARTGPAGGWEEVAEGLAYAVELAHRPQDREMLLRPLASMLQRSPSSFGKDYAMLLRTWSPAVAFLDRWGLKEVAAAPPGVKPDDTVYLVPGQPAAFGAQVTNGQAAALPVELAVLASPAGVKVRPAQATWQAKPGLSYTAPLQVSADGPVTGTLRVRVKVGTDSREVSVTLLTAEKLTLGQGVGYVGAATEPLGRALDKLGPRPAQLADLEPATLAKYRALLVGTEAHDKGYAGLNGPAARRLLDFVYSGGKVALFQLQDSAYRRWQLPYPLVVSDDEAALGALTSPEHPVFTTPHRLPSLGPVKLYDSLLSADEHWQVLARDDRKQPAIVETSFGAGKLLLVQASPDRYVNGDLSGDPQVSADTCRQFLENVLAWLGQ